MHLGEIIYNYRKQQKLSMDAFAKRADLSKAYISVLEKNEDPRTGKPIIPSIPTIEKVANAINVSFNEVFSKLDDDLLVQLDEDENTQSITDNDIIQLNEVYRKLNDSRKINVYKYAEEQLEEQNKLLLFSNKTKDEKEILIAAHIKDGVTEEGMEEILSFIEKVKKEQEEEM